MPDEMESVEVPVGIEADAMMPGEAVTGPTWADEPPPEPSSPAPPALPEAPPTEVLRPLVPGAFLRFEYEIKAILVRGITNLYLAEGGDFGSTAPKLIAERAAVAPAASDLPGAEPPLFSSSLLPAREEFVQDQRQYLIFDYFDSEALQDHREAPNDQRYLQLLGEVIDGLLELESQGLQAKFDLELLRITDAGNLVFCGFLDSTPALDEVVHPPFSALDQLRGLNAHLLRQTFSQQTTMRLDDEIGSLVLSEETKTVARGLKGEAYASLRELSEAVTALAAGSGARLDIALLSDVGQERKLNEDAGLVARLSRAAHLGSYTIDILAVADGMGGHEGGEIASDLALTTLQAALDKRAKLNWSDNAVVRQMLVDTIDEVNSAVVTMNEAPPYSSMRAKPGSTLVFAVRVGSRVFVGNVGDSRAYKWNERTGLERVTKDHSYVQSLIDNGDLTDEESWGHPDGSIITANIGDPRLRSRDVFLRLLAPGDKLLLVSDGVVDMLRDREIEPYLHSADAETVCRDLVDAANAAGGADNITAVCLVVN